MQTFAPNFERRDLIFSRSSFPQQTNQQVTRFQPRRDLFQQVNKMAVQMAAKEFVDVKTFAIEIRIERDVLLTCGLQKDVDEERATGELLDQQIARGFARYYVLALGHMLDEQRSVFGVQPF